MEQNKKHPAINELKRVIKDLAEQIKAAQYLPEPPFEGKWKLSWGTWPEFRLPLDFELIKEVEKWAEDNLLNNGWYIWHKPHQIIWNEKDAAHFVEYRMKNAPDHLHVVLRFRFDYHEGGTCKINTLKPEIKDDGVFEIVCADGDNPLAEV